MANTALKLAMMEALAGHTISTIPKKSPADFLGQVKHARPTGNLNKICLDCGHKNKKCTCNPSPDMGWKG
ncbi:hypothetical protein LCGC14_1284550 [marine sediment metagenome]|uniref:Uncharacterized protein n=1 Tax=marine sediment metagenome TaxID=412755 RepID=A0A0F9KVZ2_9ZZZZ